MKKRFEDGKITEKDWQDTIKFVNKRENKAKREQNKKTTDEVIKYLSSIVFKTSLFTFKSDERPYYVEDQDINEIFESTKTIFAVRVDKSHIKEIVTGKVFPIVDLEKENSTWESSYVRCGDLKEDDLQFSISNNNFIVTKKATFAELYRYLDFDKKIIQEYLDLKPEECKKMIKK